MTVGELKELLKNIPDDYPIFKQVEYYNIPYMESITDIYIKEPTKINVGMCIIEWN